MGRYYSGDIEGKFWFGVQNSDDGKFFGCEENEPNEISYYTDDLEEVEIGIKKCKKELKGFLTKLDKFFNEHNSYNDEMLIKKFDITEKKTKQLLTWYARLQLGKKIYKCVKKEGYCEFDAEL